MSSNLWRDLVKESDHIHSDLLLLCNSLFSFLFSQLLILQTQCLQVNCLQLKKLKLMSKFL